MKKINVKSMLLGVLLSGLVFGVINVVAVTLTAKDIKFTSNDSEWEVDNVNDAIDDLYALGVNAGINKTYSTSVGKYGWNPGDYSVNVKIADMDIPDGQYDAVLSCSSGLVGGLAKVTKISGGDFTELKSIEFNSLGGAGNIVSTTYSSAYLGKVNVTNGVASINVVFTQSVQANIPFTAILTILV